MGNAGGQIAAHRVGSQPKSIHRERRDERTLHHRPGRFGKHKGGGGGQDDHKAENDDAEHGALVARETFPEFLHDVTRILGSTMR